MHKVSGFSFLEMLIVLLVIGLLLSIVAPRLRGNNRGRMDEFVTNFQSLVTDTVSAAVTEHKPHKVLFDFEANTITTWSYHPETEEKNVHQQFVPVSGELSIPEWLHITAFKIFGQDEMNSMKRTDTAWFYCMPDGSVQAVEIGVILEDDQQMMMTVSPFYGVVGVHAV